MDLIHPHAKADVADTLRDASAHGTTVLIVGGRRHMDRGNPVEVDAELWTTQLDGVVAYEWKTNKKRQVSVYPAAQS